MEKNNIMSDSKPKAPPVPQLSSLCDDTLLRILSYCNLPSLIYLTRCTSNQLRHRFDPKEQDEDFDDGYCQNIWKEVFTNHNFVPLHKNDLSSVQYDYYNAVRHRLQLFARLAGKRRSSKTSSGKKKKAAKQCFSLPDRHFHFVPIIPPDMMSYPPSREQNGEGMHLQELDEFDELDMEHNNDMEEEDVNVDNDMEFDPPPVEWSCDSFSLTSHATGEEYVLLNPFSGSIELYNSILDNALGNEENLMELAMYDASENIIRKRNSRMHSDHDFEDERSEDIAGEAIHSRIQPKMYDSPPSQVLFSVQDYFDLDLNEYFGRHTPFGAERQGNVTVDWVGVDTHVAMSQDCNSVRGNLIGAARILTMESEHRGDEDLNCTEVFAWSNIDSQEESGSSNMYTSKYVCRAAGSFYFLDICANTQKLYATFQAGSGGFEEGNNLDTANQRGGDRNLMEIDDESLVDEGGEPIRMSRAIFRLPLIKYNGSTVVPDAIGSYFPAPEATIMAQYPVSSFSVDITGQVLIVGTIHGTVEIWQTGSNDIKPRRIDILSVREFFLRRARSMTIGARCSIESESSDDKPSSIECQVNSSPEHETQDDLALMENDGENELPHKNPTCKISQIYLPRHLPMQSCGFVTKQRNSDSGTTLLLWQTRKMSSDIDLDPASQQFQIVSMINLPLSSRCHPEVHYNGRRLIVFGQDHIGMIFLVYHVLGTRYDQDEFQEEEAPSKKLKGKGLEESGGVVNLLNERRLKFVNRIRHVGLGGLEYFDSFIMTANERFIVVNTKTGNLVASDRTRNASQGLLVIDLQDHEGRV